MRFTYFLFLLLITPTAFASDLRVRVTDPHHAPVSGAHVALYEGQHVIAVQTTTAEGTAEFHNIADTNYRVEVLAPGFALFSTTVSGTTEQIGASLSLSNVNTSVNVTAARTPLPTEDSPVSNADLTATELKDLQPVAAGDAIRFLPGAIVSNAGQRGGLTSLFVRGGESRYNKVILDGVTVNDPGGTFDFGVVPMTDIDRVEFVRGAESTLYGSDAMTSVVQFFTRNGSTRTPELRFGADGGTFQTANGYAAFSGAIHRFDYNLFGNQFNTLGQGINDSYWNSSQGANLGFAVTPKLQLRFHARHNNSFVGIPGEWWFNGQPLLPPDRDAHATQNNFLSSLDLSYASGKWQHRLTGFEYNHVRNDVDTVQEPGRQTPAYGNFDYPYHDFASMNRAGLEYQGDVWERTWTRTTFGYRFEDENGFVGDITAPPLGHGLRRNHSLYGQQVFAAHRATLIAGLRYEHNESFGNRAVPELAASYLLWNGRGPLGAFRLRGRYAGGIKEPRFEESFGVGGYNIIANPNLKPETNRSLEAGFDQSFFANKYALSAVYFDNLFRNRVDFNIIDYSTFEGQYVNVNKSFAQGAEIDLQGRPTERIQFQGAYVYTSGQILAAPFASGPLAQGNPLLRRPRHSGNLLVSYTRHRFGGTLGGTFLGRRFDSDFLGLEPPITYTAGYARFDLGAWYEFHPRITAYANFENFLNRKYEDVAGYPGLKANFRAGLRFRLGGE
ncbi:MAG: TonB-dependent receptor [Terriglobia bacterium]|nr:TonB-dependent receptor [Terriglobia bacterium]